VQSLDWPMMPRTSPWRTWKLTSLRAQKSSVVGEGLRAKSEELGAEGEGLGAAGEALRAKGKALPFWPFALSALPLAVTRLKRLFALSAITSRRAT